MSSTNYDLKPEIAVQDAGKVQFSKDLIALIKANKYRQIVIETYPGVDLAEVKKQLLAPLAAQYQIFWAEDYALSGQNFRKAISKELTNDRVFGIFTQKEYKDYFTKEISNFKKYNIVYGTGAHYLVAKPDLIIYLDIPRWEIQLKYRQQKPVFFGQTLEAETIQNFKRGYFIEWRMADRIKKALMPRIDFYVDGSTSNFKVINKKQFFASLKKVSQGPFRLVPYFDAGVWGGTWMQEHFNLGTNKHGKWAWGFDGVPEENSIRLRFENDFIEMPALNVVFFASKNLLGTKVYQRFGAEFPIRFDFLDTIKGQNLSLQVHPTNSYIKKMFNAPYTQEESYYILAIDPQAKPVCYLGVKNNINKSEFINALTKAQHTNQFEVEKYINAFEAHQHDHFLHPAGVIHSSGAGCMVLEISATPYIFTFKLWDWSRVDFDGKPRPININHGKQVIAYDFDTTKTAKELVNNFQVITNNDNYSEEKTGLHWRQFIETRRFTFKAAQSIIIHNHHSVNMLNLVSGQQIKVESIDNSFQPLIINYAETFIVPAYCKKYRITNNSNSKEKVMILQSYVRD